MSYEVIYKTVIVKNDKGEIAVVERAMSNNCFPKPTQYDPIKVFYYPTEEAFLNQVSRWKDNDCLVKIYGKYKTVADYGKHWLTRYKKAVSYEEAKKSKKHPHSWFVAFKTFSHKGCQIDGSGEIFPTLSALYDYARENNRKRCSYRVLKEFHNNEEEFFNALRQGQEVYAYLYE